jgi:Flp pilus assembly CpaF family ATPase/MinD-like ATPase involved in chromosome partitioning or flagellar assembly
MEARIISFFSPKGGVGKTLFSLNAAVSLSLKGKKVLLIDLDLGAPQVTAKLLGVEVKYSLYNLVGHMEEFKQKKRNIHNYLAHYKNNLSFLPTITKLAHRSKIDPQAVKDFLSVASSEFDFIIIDTGNNLSDNLLAAFDSSGLILLVLTPDILSVYQTEWILDTLQSIGFPLSMIKVILNRADSKGSISWQEIKVLLPSGIIALAPSDGKTVGLAVNRGIPVVIDSPHSKISLSINKLSDELIARTNLYIAHKNLTELRVSKEEFMEPEEAFWEKIGLADKAQKMDLREEEDEVIKFKRKVHKQLIEELDLKRLSVEVFAFKPERMRELRRKAERVIANIISQEAGGFISSHEVRKKITKEILDEALAFGPLEDLLKQADITEVMVNNKDQIYVERRGKLYLTSKKFTGNEQVRIVIERILAPLGRRIDESVPYVDARLPDGSRVNAIIAPLSLTGPTITIRKFARERYYMDDLINRFGSITPEMAQFLDAAVKSRKNTLVSGGTGSGKTTFLNILSSYIPEVERIVTIEDAAEIKLDQAHWIRLEARPPNIEGKGEITIRELFRNSLRMRPDRIIVGEVRGKEVIDMLQAMNTGHDGSMSTIHANTTHDVLIRLDSMILMGGFDLPIRSIREMISSALDVIVQTARMPDGSRKVTAITEVVGMLDDTHVHLEDIFYYRQTGLDSDGNVKGYFTATGYVPGFYDEIRSRGIELPRDIFISKE